MCYNQTGDFSTLEGTPLKLVDKFTYLGSSVESTEKDIDMRLTKAIGIHPTKAWLSQLVNFKNAIWHFRRTICNKILFFFLFIHLDTDESNLANTPDQAETLLHSLERAAAGIGLYVNAHKTEYMCYNQTGDFSTLDGTPIKLVDKFTYLGSSVESTKKDIDTRLTKAIGIHPTKTWLSQLVNFKNAIWHFRRTICNKILFFFFFFLFIYLDTDESNLANTPDQAETLLHSLERAAAGIGLYVNVHKTEYMCYNQTGDFSTLDGSPLKLVDKFTYLGSSVESTEKDIDTRLTKAIGIHPTKTWLSQLVNFKNAIWHFRRTICNKILFCFFFFCSFIWTQMSPTWQIHPTKRKHYCIVWNEQPQA